MLNFGQKHCIVVHLTTPLIMDNIAKQWKKTIKKNWAWKLYFNTSYPTSYDQKEEGQKCSGGFIAAGSHLAFPGNQARIKPFRFVGLRIFSCHALVEHPVEVVYDGVLLLETAYVWKTVPESRFTRHPHRSSQQVGEVLPVVYILCETKTFFNDFPPVFDQNK